MKLRKKILTQCGISQTLRSLLLLQFQTLIFSVSLSLTCRNKSHPNNNKTIEDSLNWVMIIKGHSISEICNQNLLEGNQCLKRLPEKEKIVQWLLLYLEMEDQALYTIMRMTPLLIYLDQAKTMLLLVVWLSERILVVAVDLTKLRLWT